jgi:hypothetical protein
MRIRFLALALLLTASNSFAADLNRPVRATKDSSSESDPTALRLSTEFTQEAGYATNPDLEVDGEGTAFTRTGLGLTAKKKIDDVDLQLRLKSKATYEFASSEALTWDQSAELKVEHKLSDNLKQAFTAFAKAEVEGDETDLEFESKYKVEHTSELAESELRVTVGHEAELLDADDNDREDNWTVASLQTRQVYLPENKLAPYIASGLGWVQHAKVDTPTADRTGMDVYFSGGLRYKPSELLEASFGARRNLRKTDSAALSRNYVEADITVKPFEEMELTGSVSRKFDQASADGAIVNDVKEFAAAANFEIEDDFTLGFEATHEIENAIGGDERTVTTGLSLTTERSIFKHVALTAKLSKEWETTTDLTDGSKEKAENLEAAIGVKATF